MDFEQARFNMVEQQVRTWAVLDQEVLDLLFQVRREDFVPPAYRGRGIGSALLRHCIRLAHDRGCARMEWTCLDWNRKAQQVYERIGARHLSEWYLYRLTRDGMEKFLQRSSATAASVV